MNKEKLQKIKNRINQFTRQKIKNITLSIALSATPISAATATADAAFGERQPEKISVTVNRDTSPLLAVTMPYEKNACKQSLAFASIATESLGVNSKNPASVATGNGYYGQHQFGNASQNGFMVKKYLAYALINGSSDYVESLKQNLLTGSTARKNKLIDDFHKSFMKYSEQGKPEKAFLPTDTAFKALNDAMSVSPEAFKKAHANFAKEGSLLQKDFTLDIYMHLMGTPIQTIAKNHPDIDFARIHPAVWGSVIAIAVKQGNGTKFNKALNSIKEYAPKLADRNFCTEMQAELNARHAAIGGKGKAPLAVSCRKKGISPENIVLQEVGDKNNRRIALVVYDKSGKITTGDIATAKDRKVKLKGGQEKLKEFEVIIKRSNKPQGVKSLRPIDFHDRSGAKVDFVKYINTDEWLKNYCGKQFKKVYDAAKEDINNIPTQDSYYEMSILLRRPELNRMVEQIIHKRNLQEEIKMFANNDMSGLPNESTAYYRQNQKPKADIQLARAEVRPNEAVRASIANIIRNNRSQG